MNHSKIIKNKRLKSLYLPVILLLATVILTLMVKETSQRVFSFTFKKKLTSKPNSKNFHENNISTLYFKQYKLLLNNSKSAKYFHTLKDIQDFIWSILDELQGSGNCEDKAILYCEGTDNFSGLTSMLFRYGYCLQEAFPLGRTMFIY